MLHMFLPHQLIQMSRVLLILKTSPLDTVPLTEWHTGHAPSTHIKDVKEREWWNQSLISFWHFQKFKRHRILLYQVQPCELQHLFFPFYFNYWKFQLLTNVEKQHNECQFYVLLSNKHLLLCLSSKETHMHDTYTHSHKFFLLSLVYFGLQD